MEDPAIKTEYLSKRYRGVFWRPKKTLALRNLNLEVPRGCVFGFLGPNGAGKTTTIRLLTDLIKPSAGQAWVLGQSAQSVEVRSRIGVLPDSPSFGNNQTAQRFLRLCAKLFRIPKEEQEARIEEVLTMVRMTEHRREQLQGFSRGMLQRIGIAQALLNRPELLILDEPLVGLDPHGRSELKEIVLAQKKRGATIFFSSHILSDVESLCDRVGILSKGRLRASGSLNELLSSEGVTVTVPSSEPELMQELMTCADRSERLENGSWRLAFTQEENWKKIKKREFPSGVTVEMRQESLEGYFFRLVKEDESEIHEH